MARRDFIHQAVRQALENDGWTITHDPLVIEIDEGERSFEIDLGAERIIAANRGNEQIAVEIKSFANPSILSGFHEALGQYLDYRDALAEGNVNRDLYLAVAYEIYKSMEEIPFIKRRILQYDLKIVVIDVEEQKVKQWHK
jgi:hypothetical protein